MKALHRHAPRAPAFTLLEVIIVLAITAMMLGGGYSLAQGTLSLADDLRRAERRDARMQAFTTFCEHLLAELPATAMLNLKTTQERGQYLTRLELEHVRSPFDEELDCRVTLFTEVQPGGGLRLMLTCHSAANDSSVVLFEELAQCEWRVLQPTTQQWVPFWAEDNPGGSHPKLMKLRLIHAGGDPTEQVFWVVPTQAITQITR